MLPRLAILISGAGSNMRALVAAQRAGTISADIAVVLSDRPATGLQVAKDLGLETACIASHTVPSREAHDASVMQSLQQHRIDFVILAGYMRILTHEFVLMWQGRMLNIHPSLLPRHKGLHTHRRALEAGDREHGSSVHFVTPELDGGPVILQAKFEVREGDDEGLLRERAQRCEHLIYPEVVSWLTSGRLTLRDEQAHLDGVRLSHPIERVFTDDFFDLNRATQWDETQCSP